MIAVTEIQSKEKVDENALPSPLPKLDLACGGSKQEGYLGVDICKTEATDVVHDLCVTPWPFDDNSIGEARCSHFLEHLHPHERITFMNELYRVLAPNAGCIFITPRGFDRMVQDFSHVWPPVVEGSYAYFDKQWLTTNKLLHYRELHGIRCDFEMRPMQVSITPEFALKTEEHQLFGLRHYTNVALDLVMLLVKRPVEAEVPKEIVHG